MSQMNADEEICVSQTGTDSEIITALLFDVVIAVVYIVAVAVVIAVVVFDVVIGVVVVDMLDVGARGRIFSQRLKQFRMTRALGNRTRDFPSSCRRVSSVEKVALSPGARPERRRA